MFFRRWIVDLNIRCAVGSVGYGIIRWHFSEGFVVRGALDGDDGLANAFQTPPKVIVVDDASRDIDTDDWRLLRSLKNHHRTQDPRY